MTNEALNNIRHFYVALSLTNADALNLVNEDEEIAYFTTDANYYVKRSFIIPKTPDIDYLDIAGCIEDTLHRLIEIGMSDEGIFEMLGAEKITEDNPFNEEEDYYIDLDYFIKGHLLSVFKEER